MLCSAERTPAKPASSYLTRVVAVLVSAAGGGFAIPVRVWSACA